MATVVLLGIDIGKNIFHLHSQDARGYCSGQLILDTALH